MATTYMSYVEEVMTSVAASPLGEISQELIVLGVFLVSYALWRSLGQHTKKVRAAQKLASVSVGPRKSSTGSAPQRGIAPKIRRVSENTKAIEAQILQHLEQQEFTRALNVYRVQERDNIEHNFSEDFYLSFLQSAVRVGKTDVVERLLRSLKRSGMTPSLVFWQTMLKMLSSRKHYQTCLSIYTLFARAVPSDKVVFSCLINAALEVGVPERASSMLDQYAQADLDIKDHVLFFRAYVVLKDVDSSEALFRKLGSKATTLMLNLMLLTCAHAGQAERALELLEFAHQLEAQNSLEKPLVDVVSYNTVMKGLAQAGSTSRGFECVREMSRRGIEPDDITFATLLDACIEDNNVDAVGEVVSLFTGSNRRLGTVMCTLFIKGLVKANCVPKALELYDEMRQRAGAGPDIITYSVLIKALVDQRDLDRALRLVEDMAKDGHAPDDIILTHLLEGCRHAGNHDLGKKLFDTMLASGLKPSEVTLVTMLKLHGRVGAHQEAHDLVASWEAKHDSKPSVIHYTCLMSGCLRTRSYDLAWSAYELMCKSGVKPDGTTLSTLMPGMVAARQWNRVIILARQALTTSQGNVPPETFSNALSQMLAVGRLDKQVEELRSLMEKANVPIPDRSGRKITRPSREW